MDSMHDYDDMDRVAIEKARYFFRICDSEKKGFVVKSDMRRLKNELSDLTDEQLDEVFDGLDRDGNQRLTMDEFVCGLAAFLGLQIPDVCPRAEPGNLQDELSLVEHSNASPSEENFGMFMEKIACGNAFQDQTAIRALWTKLHNEQPELLINFEEFLERVGTEIQKKTNDFTSLEHILTQRVASRDEEVQHLYEEMETQIRAEKERILAEERRKAAKQQEDLQRKLEERDKEMQELAAKHAEMEKQLENLADGNVQTEQEKEALRKEREAFQWQKEMMEQELQIARMAIEVQKEELEKLKRQTKEEKRERAKAAFKVTESIAGEREDLVKQLETLRQMNKQLVDERDELRSLQQPAVPPPIRPLGASPVKSPMRSPGQSRVSVRPEYSNDEQRYSGLAARIHKISANGVAVMEEEEDGYHAEEDDYDEELPRCMRNQHHHSFVPHQISLMSELGEALMHDGGLNGDPRFTERIGPLGGNEKTNTMSATFEFGDNQLVTPDRIFKVVFIGDSGVGKTCFLHRFCHDKFKPTFSATIGVDFQVRSINVEGRLIALQLWDTAGQERFRSITKQYFRKADGVVLMYDVTSELSYLHLRNWLQNVKEGVEADCVLSLIGNKTDLCPDENARVLKYKDGQKLADECGALFFETSAQTGEGVQQSMQALAMLLRDREDKHLEKVLNLEMQVQERKRGCCSGKRH